MMQNRCAQAKRTVCIEYAVENYDDLLKTCKQFGTIQSALPHDTDLRKYLLVQYNTEEDAQNLLAATEHAACLSEGITPLKTRFLTHKPNERAESKMPKKWTDIEKQFQVKESKKINYLKAISIDKSIDEQIQTLFDTSKLNDLSSRLRFLTALQIEEAISGIFANARVMPFGSSVNGFGKKCSDLDMMVISEQHQHAQSNLYVPQPSHFKEFERRDFARIVLGPLNVILQQFLPGIRNTQLISSARIPIIGFKHKITDLECDLTTANK